MRAIKDTIAAVFSVISMCVFGSPAFAQQYPDKPVRIVVPFTPGGGADNIGRIIAAYLQKSLEKPFIVDNRPGGGANIAHSIVANSRADGYTLLLATNSLPINQALYKQLPFNAVTSFTPISLIATSPIVIGAKNTLPIDSMSELISYAKKGRLTYSSCGIASVYHLVGERINLVANINMLHVPYKGCSQALPDVLGGEVDIFVNALPNILPHIKSGKLKVFSVTELQRSPLAPEIATFSEATGIPGISSQGWYSLMGPAGMPKDIVAKLNRVVNQALADPDLKAKLQAQLYDIKGGTPQVLTDLIASDIQIWSKIIKTGNIQPE
jgi:tripartite-type tricarboxylate transporter receptor subunit TctC